jgi:hypothetical protein
MSGIRTLEDLRQRCRIDDETGCWVWADGLNGSGNPCARMPGAKTSTTVGGILTALVGSPGAGRYWVAACGNAMCMRRAAGHRVPGTRSEQAKRAKPKLTTLQRANIAAGRNAGSRMSVADVRAIRSGEVSTVEAAQKHGITVSYAWAIRVGVKRAFCGEIPGSSVFTMRAAA